MSNNPPPVRIGVLGTDSVCQDEPRGCALWPPGYAAAVDAAKGIPVTLEFPRAGRGWDEILGDLDGVLLLGIEQPTPRQAHEQERLCQWCGDRQMPLLGVDRGALIINTTFSGTNYAELARELTQALQHRHPPEKGLRHAITVTLGTRLARLYGEGEIVVNSEHRGAVNKPGRGFLVSARALDGVIEAIEPEDEEWFAMGVQWHPASASASGLDIQLFRGLVDACLNRQQLVGAGHRVAA
jgi:putative glutamine amidotransferase